MMPVSPVISKSRPLVAYLCISGISGSSFIQIVSANKQEGVRMRTKKLSCKHAGHCPAKQNFKGRQNVWDTERRQAQGPNRWRKQPQEGSC